MALLLAAFHTNMYDQHVLDAKDEIWFENCEKNQIINANAKI